MSEQTRRAMVQRVREALAKLDAISEAPAGRSLEAKPKITGGKEGDDMPTSPRTLFDQGLDRFADVCDWADKAVGRSYTGRIGPQPEMTPGQQRYWWGEDYRGMSAARAAYDAKVPQRAMEDFYRTKGWDLRTGRPRAA